MIKLDLIYNYSYLGGVIHASSLVRTKPASFFKEKTIKNLKLVFKKTKSLKKIYEKRLNIRKYLLKKLDVRSLLKNSEKWSPMVSPPCGLKNLVNRTHMWLELHTCDRALNLLHKSACGFLEKETSVSEKFTFLHFNLNNWYFSYYICL